MWSGYNFGYAKALEAGTTPPTSALRGCDRGGRQETGKFVHQQDKLHGGRGGRGLSPEEGWGRSFSVVRVPGSIAWPARKHYLLPRRIRVVKNGQVLFSRPNDPCHVGYVTRTPELSSRPDSFHMPIECMNARTDRWWS